jgi:isochorismate pyruvate lyase
MQETDMSEIAAQPAFVAPEPAECRSLAEVRSGVDEIDGRMIDLLQRRWAYTLKAAMFKPARDRVRDEARIEIQVQGAVRRGEHAGLPAEFIERFWRSMIDLHVEYEVQEFERLSGAS